ncbi:MAG: NAD(P)-dependent glycerol-3-phosphate dehydrogenase [Rhodobacteraceae bacterium]|nr:NAD(P)-dependent glycerol-3-phosphate dehydrogenase [Paracoccaceae bacterium]
MKQSIAVLGAGAFGTSLAISMSRDGNPVSLWARDIRDMAEARENSARLSGFPFPKSLTVTDKLARAAQADILLIATPMQALSDFLTANQSLFQNKTLVTCCKGVDLSTGLGPVEIVRNSCPSACVAVLSGPGFAVDIAKGLPTALTLASDGGERLQEILSNETLRLYRSSDLTGVALGGALKNIVAMACGLAIGAGLGESARAALLTRGFAEMNRFARHHGAHSETLAGLSGLGDLVLTATSEKSRNYAYGLALGRGDEQAAKPGTTIEGMATAKAVSIIAKKQNIDMPVTDMVVAVLTGHLTIEEAKSRLLSRPLKEE